MKRAFSASLKLAVTSTAFVFLFSCVNKSKISVNRNNTIAAIATAIAEETATATSVSGTPTATPTPTATATPGPWTGTKQLGATTIGRGITAYSWSLAKDSSDSIYMAGYTNGSLDQQPLYGGTGFFLKKFNNAGTAQWTRILEISNYNNSFGGYAGSVAVDTADNIYAAGFTVRGMDGNAQIGTNDFFLTKYDTSGSKLWTKELGVAAGSTFPQGVATDSGDNVYVCGFTNGNLDGGTLTGGQDLFVTKYNSSGTKQWTRLLGVAAQATAARAIVVDSGDNIYVAGYTTGGLDGNSLAGTQDLFVTKYDAAGTKAWTQQLGIAAAATIGYAIGVDSGNNIYVSGSTSGGLDGNSLTGTTDLFVTKYNSAGAKQWTQQLGVATKNTYSYTVGVDGSNNIYLSGLTYGGLDGNSLNGIVDLFVTKYNSSGTKQWTKLKGVTGGVVMGQGLTIDSSNNVYLTGTANKGFDGNSLQSNGDYHLTKMDNSGTTLFTKEMGPSPATVLYGITSDSEHSIYVTGYTYGELDGNANTLKANTYVTKYDRSGTKQWTRTLGGSAADAYAYTVTTDANNNVYMAGATAVGLDGNTQAGSNDLFFTKYSSSGVKQWTIQRGAASQYMEIDGSTTDHDGNLLFVGMTTTGMDGNAMTGSLDLLLMKYDTNGSRLWTRQLGVATKNAYGFRVAVDSANNIYVGGQTNGNLDGNTLTGAYDAVITKYNSAGTKQWTKLLGAASGYASANGIVADSGGNVYMTGSTDHGLDGNSQAGPYDIFVVKYDTNGNKLWLDQKGVASVYTWTNGITLDSSGNVYITGNSGGGLDGNALVGNTDGYIIKYDSGGTRQWTEQFGVSKCKIGNGSAIFDLDSIYFAGDANCGIDGNTLTGTRDFFISKYSTDGIKQ